MAANRDSIDSQLYQTPARTPAFRRHSSRRSVASPISYGSSFSSRDDERDADRSPPPMLPTPSSGSRLSYSSSVTPLRKSMLHDDHDIIPTSPGRIDLARRLSNLARELTHDGEVDELALETQLDQMEKVLASGSPSPSPFSATKHRRPHSLDMRSFSDFAGSLPSSPASSFMRSRFSDLSSSLYKVQEPAHEDEEGDETRELHQEALTIAQANKIIAEAGKLNEELTTIVHNLTARQEEANHIQDLLIERAERAAQRIIFLQNRIGYLEKELQDNDEELQHLRICLKAVEIQMPPHPDRELQRCIAAFKDDYRALKKKRAIRSSVSSFSTYETSQIDFHSSPR
ncbi:unnamed protein product [Clonostachys solani]|uniref:Uncharacterized protein n=1 Tax=Clonostachys solani TaxID=160281 RepID=A0A9P0EEQ0_9HYPO|nr:unnamed protein product [Clonostachys solani]